MNTINEPSSTDLKPIYNIKAVSRQTGLLPVTLRAWERRYGLPSPERGGQGYRLYSDYDIRTLRWLKSKIDSGLTIGRAAQYLQELRAAGMDPAAANPPINSLSIPSASLEQFSARLLEALTTFDNQRAAEILRRLLPVYPIDQVMEEVIQPVLIEIGEAWHRGELPISVEHFATQFFIQHLMNMLSMASVPMHSGVIVAAGAPGETHQVGLLMLVVLLRWRGWDVRYLGPDLSMERIAEALRPIYPRILLFTATLPTVAENLRGLPKILAEFPLQPLVIVGGQGFKAIPSDTLADLSMIHLDGRPIEIVKSIEKLMVKDSLKPENLDKTSTEQSIAISSK